MMVTKRLMLRLMLWLLLVMVALLEVVGRMGAVKVVLVWLE